MPNAPEDNPDPIEKSLGDEATGADVSRVEQERSLGDQSTSGDALSSMSDLVEGLDADPALRTLAGHTDAVWSVAFSPDGKQIVSGSQDKTLRIWDISDLAP